MSIPACLSLALASQLLLMRLTFALACCTFTLARISLAGFALALAGDLVVALGLAQSFTRVVALALGFATFASRFVSIRVGRRRFVDVA